MEQLKIVSHVHFGREKHGKRRLLAGRAPKPEPQVEQGVIPRLSRLMALAIHFEDVLERGEVKDMAEIARLVHGARARLQYRHIHPLTVTASWKKQREMWVTIVQLLAPNDARPPVG